MRKLEEIGFPKNLLLDVFVNDEKRAEQIAQKCLNDEDYMNGLMKALDNLKTVNVEREKEILLRYYQDFVPAVDIGEEYGITSSRIHQIRHRAIRKLRHPSRSCFIINGVKGEEKRQENLQMKKRNEFEKQCAEFPYLSYEVMQKDLSARTFNAFARYETENSVKLTIAALDEMADEDMLNKFQHFGVGCLKNTREAIVRAKILYTREGVPTEAYEAQMTSMDAILDLCVERLEQIGNIDTSFFLEAVRKRRAELKNGAKE